MADFAKNDDPFKLLSFDPAAVAIRAARNGDMLDKLELFVKELDHYVRLNRHNSVPNKTERRRSKVDPGGEYKEVTVYSDDDVKEHKEDDTAVSAGGNDNSAHAAAALLQHQHQMAYGGYPGLYSGGYPPVMGMHSLYMSTGCSSDVCFACGTRFSSPRKSPGNGLMEFEDGTGSPTTPVMPPLIGSHPLIQQQQQQHQQQQPPPPTMSRKRSLEAANIELDSETMIRQKQAFHNLLGGQDQPELIEGVLNKLPARSKANWSKEEDAIVVEVVSRSKDKPFTAWSELAHCIPGRSGKSIRDRWINHLNPALVHAPFTAEDDHALWKAYKEYGKRWVEISGKVFQNTRSENQIKNRWYSAAFKKFIAKEYGPNALSEVLENN